jgi:2-amino-4-hydroxy-6-hydroxymethyldihydropteridine diphosphokinase
VYLGLGSNIDPEKNLRTAADMLRKVFPGIRFSSIYRSAPLMVKDQPEFLNAAAVFETEKTPEKVASELRKIEKKLKKNPPERFGPRTIDLDLLLYGQEIGLDDELTIPHLAMHQRRFVLEPLIELGAGDVMHPGFDVTLKEYLANVQHQHCEKTKLEI